MINQLSDKEIEEYTFFKTKQKCLHEKLEILILYGHIPQPLPVEKYQGS